MITAEEARNLNPMGRIEEYRTFLEKKITDAAKKRGGLCSHPRSTLFKLALQRA